MSTVIDRDPELQKKFGEYLLEVENNFRETCISLKNHVAEARDDIQDDEARKALEDVEGCADNILKLLPDIAEFGEKQIVKARYIIEAEGTKFTRH